MLFLLSLVCLNFLITVVTVFELFCYRISDCTDVISLSSVHTKEVCHWFSNLYSHFLIFILWLYSPRDTCGSWLPPSLYYDVMDSDGQSLLKIEGPACKMEFCSTTAFRVRFLQTFLFVFYMQLYSSYFWGHIIINSNLKSKESFIVDFFHKFLENLFKFIGIYNCAGNVYLNF